MWKLTSAKSMASSFTRWYTCCYLKIKQTSRKITTSQMLIIKAIGNYWKQEQTDLRRTRRSFAVGKVSSWTIPDWNTLTLLLERFWNYFEEQSPPKTSLHCKMALFSVKTYLIFTSRFLKQSTLFCLLPRLFRKQIHRLNPRPLAKK